MPCETDGQTDTVRVQCCFTSTETVRTITQYKGWGAQDGHLDFHSRLCFLLLFKTNPMVCDIKRWREMKKLKKRKCSVFWLRSVFLFLLFKINRVLCLVFVLFPCSPKLCLATESKLSPQKTTKKVVTILLVVVTTEMKNTLTTDAGLFKLTLTQ